MQVKIRAIKPRIQTAQKELEQARKRHEAKETGVHDLVNRIVSVRKATALFEHQYDLIQLLIEKAKARNQSRTQIELEMEASFMLRDIEGLKQRELQLIKQIQHETGTTPTNKPTQMDLVRERVARRAEEKRFAASEFEKMKRIAGHKHPQTQLTHADWLHAKSELNAELWKLKQLQAKEEKDPRKRKNIKRARSRAARDYQALGEIESDLRKEIKEEQDRG